MAGVCGLGWMEYVAKEGSGIGPGGSPGHLGLDLRGDRGGLVVHASEAW